MNQLSSVLTILAVIWTICMLPAALAVMQFHPNNWFLIFYVLFGFALFIGIGVLRVARKTNDRRRKGKD